MMDNLMLGLETTVIGVGIVFLALYALSLIMLLLRKIFYTEPAVVPAEEAGAAMATTPVSGVDKPEEIIAAIAAAIAAVTGKSTDQFSIAAVRRQDQQTAWSASGWKMAGRTEIMEKRQEHYR